MPALPARGLPIRSVKLLRKIGTPDIYNDRKVDETDD